MEQGSIYVCVCEGHWEEDRFLSNASEISMEETRGSSGSVLSATRPLGLNSCSGTKFLEMDHLVNSN